MFFRMKSTPENWDKEFTGRKHCTVRQLDTQDIIQLDKVGSKDSFTAKVTDITIHKDTIIFSFNPDTRKLVKRS